MNGEKFRFWAVIVGLLATGKVYFKRMQPIVDWLTKWLTVGKWR